MPTYVEYGAADIGVVGKDTILEEARNIYEVLDLKVCFARRPFPRANVKYLILFLHPFLCNPQMSPKEHVKLTPISSYEINITSCICMRSARYRGSGQGHYFRGSPEYL